VKKKEARQCRKFCATLWLILLTKIKNNMNEYDDFTSLEFFLSEEEFSQEYDLGFLDNIEKAFDEISKVEQEVKALQEGRACPVINN